MLIKNILIAISMVCLSGAAHAENIKTEDNAVQLFMAGDTKCSGVKIGENTVLTAAHCVVKEDQSAGENVIGVRVPKGKTSIGTPVKVDKDRDLALIALDSGAVTSELLNLGEEPNNDETVLTMVGFGGGEANVDTIIGRMITLMPRPFETATDGSPVRRLSIVIAVDTPIIGGMSGGPAVNSAHQLVGINSATRVANALVAMVGGGSNGREPSGFVVATREIKAFLREAGLNV